MGERVKSEARQGGNEGDGLLRIQGRGARFRGSRGQGARPFFPPQTNDLEILRPKCFRSHVLQGFKRPFPVNPWNRSWLEGGALETPPTGRYAMGVD